MSPYTINRAIFKYMNTWHRSQTFRESLGYALSGIKAVWVNEPNLKRQVAVGTVVLVLACLLRLAPWDVLLLIIVSGMVLTLEVVNSAIELLLDALHPEYDERLKVVKDMLAAAVLLMSLVAVVVGIYILGLPLITLVAGLLN